MKKYYYSEYWVGDKKLDSGEDHYRVLKNYQMMATWTESQTVVEYGHMDDIYGMQNDRYDVLTVKLKRAFPEC